MITGSNGDRSGDTRPLWITGLSPPDSWRSLRQPGYPQLDRVRHPKHRVWGYGRTLKVRNFRSTKVGNFQSQLTVPVEQPPDRALGRRQAMPRVQVCRDLAQGDVRRLVNQRQDFLGMGLDPVRAVVTALRPRPDIARPPPPIHPFDRRRGRNPEAARRRAPRQAAVNRRYKPFSKIIGKRFRHAGWPPPPAHILNQKFDPMGIPKRIRQLRKCSSGTGSG